MSETIPKYIWDAAVDRWRLIGKPEIQVPVRLPYEVFEWLDSEGMKSERLVRRGPQRHTGIYPSEQIEILIREAYLNRKVKR